MNTQAVIYLVRGIETALAAMGAAPEVIARWQRTGASVRDMVSDGRPPTAEEWALVNSEIASNATERDAVIATKRGKKPAA